MKKQLPPARTVSSSTGNEGIFINSIISNGVIISGGSVHNSILSPDVHIDDDATVANSILFDHVQVGKGCKLHNCIIDKHVKVPAEQKLALIRSKMQSVLPFPNRGLSLSQQSISLQSKK